MHGSILQSTGIIILYSQYIIISFRDSSKKYKLTAGDVIMYQREKCNLKAFGQAVREARESRGWSREYLAERLDLAPRYIMYIETRGQHPSLQRLYEMSTLFGISIDQFFFPDSTASKTTRRRQLDIMLDSMDDEALSIVSATAKALQESRGMPGNQ